MQAHINYKICSCCKQNISVSNFGIDNSSPDKLTRACRPCLKIRAKINHEKNPSIRSNIDKRYRASHLEKCRRNDIKRYNDNSKKEKERHKKYRDKNREKINKKSTERYWNNIEKSRAIQRKAATKRRTTIVGKLNNIMSSSLCHVLKTNKAGSAWKELVGYNHNDLRDRLSFTMPGGYSWNDFMSGKLHIDHIMPISSFNFIDAEDEGFKKCWALDNLQLLPASENLSKNNRTDYYSSGDGKFYYNRESEGF